MRGYTVKQVAKLSGVSVRTLHHYDEIGLLTPGRVGANGYRDYGRDDLLRLQQILFHRELGFPLDEIRQVLDAPDFDRAAALRRHRARLQAETRRYRRLIMTIDDTLAALKGATTMNDKSLYMGFSPEKQAQHEAWLVGRYGPGMKDRIADSKAALGDLSPTGFEALMAEAEGIEADMAQALADGLAPDSDPVTAIMARQWAWVGKGWNRAPTRGDFEGLGRMYKEHPEFRARYDARAPGLADYLAQAMRAYARRPT